MSNPIDHEVQVQIQYRLMEQLSASERRYRSLLEHLREIVFQCDAQGRLTFLNSAWTTILGYPLNDSLGQPLSAFLDADGQVIEANSLHHWASEQHTQILRELRVRSQQGAVHWFDAAVQQQADGSFNGSLHDITARKQAEAEHQRAQAEADRAWRYEQTIALQTTLLAERSTPIIPITERVMVVPLIGSVDEQRAQQITETLLTAVTEHLAEVVILDITGVALIDTAIANGLLRAAQAVQLLGAKMVLTGIRPEVAQSLVGLGVDLGSLITRSTVQSGIAWAMARRA